MQAVTKVIRWRATLKAFLFTRARFSVILQMAGIYIHIPFCKQACNYCNFHFSTSQNLMPQMIAALHNEMEMQRFYLENESVETIYFGGGTPSLLSADEISRLINYIHTLYNANDLKEITLEANPDDLTNQYIKALRGTEVNRFSIGVQSFKEADLKYMNRAHTAQEADYSIKLAQDAGFTNLTIDLIYGTPGLKDNEWLFNLQKVAELGIPHFSAYALTVEEGTALATNIRKKKTVPVDADQAAAQFEALMDTAASMGYEHYEISNLSLPGHQAVHNTNYWMGKPYLGIGPSAHSFNGKTRRWNISNNALYIKNVSNGSLLYEEEHLTSKQQLNEYIMTSLRTMWGCNLERISSTYGETTTEMIKESAQKFIDMGKVKYERNKLILTNSGKLFADNIASELFII